MVPKGHPLASRKSLAYAEVLPYEQVEQAVSSELTQLLDYSASQAGVVKRTRIRVRGFESMCNMIAAHMGVGVLPSFLKPSQIRLNGLRFIPLTDAWAHQHLCILVRDVATLLSAARAFIEHLRPGITKSPDWE
ncbi:LysR substrate-binding domain-containing protein [Variovorax sp. LjRoot290]